MVGRRGPSNPAAWRGVSGAIGDGQTAFSGEWVDDLDGTMTWEDALIEAESLLLDLEQRSPETLGRVQARLDQVLLDPNAPRAPVAWIRARAMMTLQLEAHVPALQGLQAVLEALEHMPAPDDRRTWLELGAANFFTLLKDPILERRFIAPVEAAMRGALEACEATPRIHLATRLLAQVQQRALALDLDEPAQRLARYREARQLAALAIDSAIARHELMELAGNFEIAGLIEASHPVGDADALEAASGFLRQARDRYRALRGPDDARRCAFKLIDLWEQASRPPTLENAHQVEENLLAVEWSYTLRDAVDLAFPPGQLEAAQTWLLAARGVSGAAAANAFERVAGLAHRLVEAPIETSDPRTKARAYFLLGNAIGREWLTASDYPRLTEDVAAQVTSQMASAREAFHQALALAPPADLTLITRTWAQLAKTWTVELGACGDLACAQPALTAWREAVARAPADDQISYSLNLVSVLLRVASEGDGRDLEEAEAILAALGEDRLAMSGLASLSRSYRDRLAAIARAPWSLGSQYDYRRALRLARDPDLRRRYLDAQVPRLPDYIERRAFFLSAGYRQVEAELAALRRSDYAQHEPGAMRALEAQAASQRMAVDEMLDGDRQINSAAAGKAFVARHLEDASPFVLVLRSFDLERRFTETQTSSRGELADILEGADAMSSTVVVAGHRVLSDLLEQMGEECVSLMVMNIEDPFPPKASTRLFADPRDWRALVFALAMQASAIVVAMADAEAPTAGVSDEIRALVDLGAVDRTVVLLQAPLRGLNEALVAGPPALSDGLRTDLTQQGYHLVFNGDEVEADPKPFLAAVDLIRQRFNADFAKP